MDSADEIKRYLAYSLSFGFRLSPTIDVSEYRIKYAEITEYAHEVAKSFLGKDTIRYQSILMSVSLLAALIYAFNLETVEISDQVLQIDTTFFIFLTVFAAGVSVIFLGKSFIDYKTHKIREDAQKGSVNAATEMIDTGWQKVEIDRYFWFKVFNLIGQTQNSYRDELAAVENTTSDFQSSEFGLLELPDLDMQDLKSREALRDTIESRERSFAKIEISLLYDWSEFKVKVTGVPAGDPNGLSIFTKAHDVTLQKWIDARLELTDLFLKAADQESPELEMVHRVTDPLVKARQLRWVVVALEVLFPVVLAIAAISLVWFFAGEPPPVLVEGECASGPGGC